MYGNVQYPILMYNIQYKKATLIFSVQTYVSVQYPVLNYCINFLPFSGNNQYASALQFYLQSASIITGFFEMPPPRDVWNDQVYRRLIKCCSQLQCFTLVALLCQFLQPVDYTTAFKALQEKTW